MPEIELPLLPARMVNEFVYCPRLAYLEWVQGEWDDNLDTIHGRWVHRRADEERPRRVPGPDDVAEDAALTARSLLLSAPVLGAIARIDVLEAEGRVATPVDYKRGRPPENTHRAWDPERVQLCVQGLVLRENGYTCDGGVLYFAESKERVDVEFDELLVFQTEQAMEGLRAMARAGRLPPPLVDSPKCVRCSLNAICLPDETHALSGHQRTGVVRRLVAARPDARPVYVQEQGATVRKQGEVLVVTSPTRDAPVRVLLKDTSALVLMGNIQVTTQTVRALLEEGVPITYQSAGGWYVGQAGGGVGHANVEVRLAQHRVVGTAHALDIARAMVAGKVLNQRTFMRRNLVTADRMRSARLALLVRRARASRAADELMGIEGAAAREYFGAFAGLFNDRAAWAASRFKESGRTRRPPLDPVNAVLGFLYAQLVRECTTAALLVGFDPHVGFLHAPRYGRPALALDLMEEFRPLVADSVAVTLFNQGEIGPDDVVSRARGVMLTPTGRRTVLAGFERRLEQLVTHPQFGYRVSYRRLFELQARLLRAVVVGELPGYRPFTTR